MKKVAKVTRTTIVLEDGEVIYLQLGLDRELSLEEAQELYERMLSLKTTLYC